MGLSQPFGKGPPGAPATPLVAGSTVLLAIRAEEVIIRSSARDEPVQGSTNQIEGRGTALQSAGPLVTVSVDYGFPLKAYLLGPSVRSMNFTVDSAVTVAIAREAIHVMI